MPAERGTAVAIPCYNEERRLAPEAFLEAIRADPDLAFVFVDDGSTDGTLGLLRDLVGQVPDRMEVLELERNSGKAEAVRQGISRGFSRGPRLVGYWDADRATPLSYIRRFAERFDDPKVEMVLGSRVRLLGRRVQRSMTRHYVGRGFATIAGLALKLPVYDTQCGAKLFRADAIFRDLFARPFELDWCFDVEIFARLLEFEQAGRLEIEKQCVEYPLEEWADAAGSKLTVRQFPNVLREILKLSTIARRARKSGRRAR
jgi:dolichyl-phosphate beta-glucosyltransferase